MRDTPYHNIIPERVEILDEIKKVLGKNGEVHFSTNYAGRELPFLSYVINPKVKKTIMITAGCHGNEPAPIYALYELLKKGLNAKGKRVVIVPCIVPYGFCLHVDKNINGKDINRDFFSKNSQRETKVLKQLVKKFKPRFVLNMHEDPDEEEFYLYLEGKEYREIAEKLIKVVGVDYYKKKKIHNNMIKEGIIESPQKNGSFEDYLIEKGVANFCTETPGMWSLKKRVEVYGKVLKYVIQYC